MRKGLFILLGVLLGLTGIKAQEPDLSKLTSTQDKIKAWIAYCESLHLNSKNSSGNYTALQQAALKGVNLAPADDPEDRGHFYYFAAFGYYYQVKFDSAQYCYYQCLHEAQKAKDAQMIANACVALIPVNFQLQQQSKVDSCKDILQSVMDTTHNTNILQDGYSALGSYYQQKSYYSAAQNYLIKSIELRKKIVDTTQDPKVKLNYAILCYMLAKLYGNTDMHDKGLASLKEGQKFAIYSPLVDTRYLSSFTEEFCTSGNIDSALYYDSLLELRSRNSPVVLSESVSADISIAQYYINNKQYNRAGPFVEKADALATKSKSPILIYQSQMAKGRYLKETGKPAEAIILLNQSMPVARKISREEYTEVLKYMAEAQEAVGNKNAALQYYKQYTQQLDSLTKETVSRNIADQETRYQTSQKEQRIAVLDKENQLEVLELQNAYRTRLLLVVGLAALGVIALLLYFNYRDKEKLNQILNKKNDQLGELNDQLAVANETKAKLFGIIGHDLRAPIGKIVQLLQIQKESPDLMNEQSRQKHEEKLKTASENVLETMEDLLLWSKSQMQHFTPQFSPVKISETIQKEINFLHESTEDKNLKVHNEVPSGFVQNTDENFLSVIIRNLLQNSVKYGDEGSTISISAAGRKILITNQMVHARTEDLNRLLENTQVNSKSSGMGLQIAKDLTTSIQARIFFQQQDNQHLTAVISWEK
ncbi:MAG: HAMP domain-containing sensor histidine kinase [Bacteroidota bacterium]|nr:HAMP domain-containing sensor histidine kinase [Bacteroidota bacterium]MDP4211784.1 HAMP domain-containing sensor histidine kinase [Bacteroidota bacterium]MDP4248982.1 HAMP domain-containing sensor histidine kinase [Bacteroidota bacterium]